MYLPNITVATMPLEKDEKSRLVIGLQTCTSYIFAPSPNLGLVQAANPPVIPHIPLSFYNYSSRVYQDLLRPPDDG
jgi:hypothetical protein